MTKPSDPAAAPENTPEPPRTSRRALLGAGLAAVAAATVPAVPATARRRRRRSRSTPAFEGDVVGKGDPRYPTLQRGSNQRHVASAGAIHLPGTARDVMRSVRQALRQGVRITVRGGGHCYEDFTTRNPGGILIDLSAMSRIHTEPDDPETLVVEGGATLLDVYTQLFRRHGRTLPGGSCYSVGIAGHASGGGYGLLSRLHGLVADHLHGAEVITVDRGLRVRRVRVTRDTRSRAEADLFWALTGGGGGTFGIVTRFLFRLDELPRPPGQVVVTNAAWDWNRFADRDAFRALLLAYGAHFEAHHAPGEPENALFSVLKLGHRATGRIGLTVQEAIPGPGAGAPFTRDLLARLSGAAGPPDTPAEPARPGELPWLQATHLLGGAAPHFRAKNKSCYLKRNFTEDHVSALHEHLSNTRHYANADALVQVDSYGGEINRPDPAATPLPQRSSILKLQYQTYWTDPREDNLHLGWIRHLYRDAYYRGANAEPVPDGTVDGCYVNYPDRDLVDWPLLYWGPANYARLQRAKSLWDPNDVFRHAQSVRLPG